MFELYGKYFSGYVQVIRDTITMTLYGHFDIHRLNAQRTIYLSVHLLFNSRKKFLQIYYMS